VSEDLETSTTTSTSHLTTTTTTTITTSRLTVPIVPMCVPSPETAGLLTAFLYTRDERQLVRALVGMEVAAPPAYDPEAKVDYDVNYDTEEDDSDETDPTTLPTRTLPDAILHTSLLLSSPSASSTQASQADAAQTMSHLTHRAHTIASLWRNACAMGVCDTRFWKAGEVSWAVVVGAASVVGGRVRAEQAN
jgi:hypothetical protein